MIKSKPEANVRKSIPSFFKIKHRSFLLLQLIRLLICRINLPKRRCRAAEGEEGEGDAMKSSGSSEQLDADGDTGSEVSSEVSFSYEFAQTEVLMKALGSNGEAGEDKAWSRLARVTPSPDLFATRSDAGRPAVTGEAARRGEALGFGATAADVRAGTAAAAQEAAPGPSVRRPAGTAAAGTTASLPQHGAAERGRGGPLL